MTTPDHTGGPTPTRHIYPSGSYAWLLNGAYHRSNGPAVVTSTGDRIWFQHGHAHRDNGPAYEHPDRPGTAQWYLHGQKVTAADVVLTWLARHRPTTATDVRDLTLTLAEQWHPGDTLPDLHAAAHAAATT